MAGRSALDRYNAVRQAGTVWDSGAVLCQGGPSWSGAGSGWLVAAGKSAGLMNCRFGTQCVSMYRTGGNLMAIETLIIDDSPVARRVVRHHLEQIGCKVVDEAENPCSGLTLFRERKPQLVTLDLIMPAVDGIDAMQALQAMKKENPRVEIVIVSAIPFEKTRRNMADEGALAYIIKPFNKFSFDQARMRLLRAFPELAGVEQVPAVRQQGAGP